MRITRTFKPNVRYVFSEEMFLRSGRECGEDWSNSVWTPGLDGKEVTVDNDTVGRVEGYSVCRW